VKLPLTSVWCRGQRVGDAVPPLPHAPSWRGAQLGEHRNNLPYLPM